MSSPRTSRRAFLGGLGAGAAALVATIPAGPAGAANGHPPAPHGAHAAPPDVVPRWIDALYAAVLAEGLTPPAAARFYAHTSIAMYEAVVAGSPIHRSLGGQLNALGAMPAPKPGRIDWPIAVSAAARATSQRLLPSTAAEATRARLDDVHAEVVAGRAAAGVPEPHRRAAIAHGEAVAAAVTDWSATDGHAGTVGRPYTPPVGPGLWESTPPRFNPAVEPHWDEVRPLTLRAAEEVAPAPHVPYDEDPSSAFWAQAEVVAEVARNRTQEQIDIARFWTDNPLLSGLPSGHWHLITAQLSAQAGLSLPDRLEVHARVGVALHDAFWGCWVWKYRLGLLRPITYIQRVMRRSEFTTVVNTPQFPEYTSGHSVASAAAAVVLTDRFGALGFTDASGVARDLPPRSFASPWAAAHEAARSRLYGGIHFPMGIDAGLDQGEGLGRLVAGRLRTRR